MSLKGKKIAVFVANLFEDLEFWYPYIRMREAGADVESIGPKKDVYTGKHGLAAKADRGIHDVQAPDYDALIIPGGYSPDHMRRSPKMVEFVREMHQEQKIIAAICHGGWMLASADIIRDKQVTSFFAIKDDLVNAGANWDDKEVVKDDNIITSRTPDDLPVFCKTIIGSLK